MFEWDEKKNLTNRQKHGVWFEEAQSVFGDVYARYFYDGQYSGGEDRFIILGMSSASRVLVVVHCHREKVMTRIISARKASKKESEFYYEKRI